MAVTRSRIVSARAGFPAAFLLDDPLDHRPGKGNAAGLDRLQIAGREQMDTREITGSLHRGGHDGLKGGQPFTLTARKKPDGVVEFQQVAHRRHFFRRDVDEIAAAQNHQRRPRHVRPPDAPDECSRSKHFVDRCHAVPPEPISRPQDTSRRITGKGRNGKTTLLAGNECPQIFAKAPKSVHRRARSLYLILLIF
jgi:hypothetical protein